MASSLSSYKRSFSDLLKETLGGSSSSKQLYDVFINYRASDTKDTVAFALYDSLEKRGFRTFLGVKELRLVDSIKSAIDDAINSSAVQIVIFSPRYAESRWRLDELVHMFKTKALFIPVFCDVRPADLRYPEKGVYNDAFAEHERKGRISNKRLEQWKDALSSSSLISGYEFNTSNDNVEELCTRISSVVQQRVGKDFPSESKSACEADVAASKSRSAQWKKSGLLPRDSHPVGIDSKVEDIKYLLQNPENQVIAVVGMGGLGKTFLLQNVYSAVKSGYDHSIWLSISKSYSLKNLQQDIASHIGLMTENLTEERAAELIHGRLEGKKSLIVLDDLWELSVEDDLLEKLGLPVHKDCKIVVTTRSRKVAMNLNAHIYQMACLSDEYSWRLFCIYAFPNIKGNKAPANMEETGRWIVKQCGNVPLAIKTTAASLARDTYLSKWEFWRRLLERAFIPFGKHDSVMEILKLSYDSLPPHLKPCFACLSFFPGDAKIECEYLVYLWIAEGLIPAEAGEKQWDMAWDWLGQLAQLSLLHLCEDEELIESSRESISFKYCKIHDLLYDLIIRISKENKYAFSLDKTTKLEDFAVIRTQLQEIRLTVTEGMDMKRIRAIVSQLINLRVLGLVNWSEIDYPLISENMAATLKHLESLTLESFAVPNWICDLANLRELKLEDCECNNYPELQRMPSLESLYLKLNDLCRVLPKAFGKCGAFPNLRVFTVDKLYELEEFPDLEEGAMTNLKEFYLLECPNLEKVEGLERLKNLKLFSWEGSGTDRLWEILKESGEYWKKIKAINSEVIIINSPDI